MSREENISPCGDLDYMFKYDGIMSRNGLFCTRPGGTVLEIVGLVGICCEY